ncbi:hypothetical protein [Sulfitobacter guttiformis]|uniref:Antifreeze glycopeptide polyprotein n=1 Tax=Sulfitobacter guttiformis TaxID=74349 RepID=A0A420DIC6_9RHOB|nr:hypothetical protein [Sulfitobacter guttiformis]KIN72253.1 hypothetical protein Z949_1426 [Sulfitobacter guttiformis KCTC 32187]RKE93978.1 hypothetical protein C8N30_3082 [Sulfitobacter guttiformis]
MAHGAYAQTAAPLSVIDWLDNPVPLAEMPRAPAVKPQQKIESIDEPAVTDTGTAPQITSRPLTSAAPMMVGLAPMAMTGMQPDLWTGSDVDSLVRRIASLPDLDLPAANALLFTVLLAEANAPSGGDTAQDTLTKARVGKLMTLGAIDPALALIEQAGAATSPVLFDLWMELSLLVGTEDDACGALSRAPRLTDNTATKIFCAARSGDWDTAALTFSTASALSLVPRETLDVLDRFLNPDLFETAPPLPAPREMDPLTFRLFETIGEPLPTGPLPRTYAFADLRDITGWKSQLEAAERLTRAGALPENRLLGLYTDRRAAASGGIWDRVRAVQMFDAALASADAQTVANTLPAVWREMKSAELEVSFATSFQERLSAITLSGEAAITQARIGLLSPAYESTATAMASDIRLGEDTELIRAVAGGEVSGEAPSTPLPRAIHDAFSSPTPNATWVGMAQSGQLGEALIATLDALRDGARGDSRALREALGTLRALGLEDTARRASLQILLLERTP